MTTAVTGFAGLVTVLQADDRARQRVKVSLKSTLALLLLLRVCAR